MTQRGLAVVVAVVATAGLLAACDDDRRAISRDDLPEVPAEPTEVIELGDDGFDTDELVVSTADLVEFRNVGDDDHGVRTDDHRIDSGLLRPGESTFVVFDEPDRYDVVDVADAEQSMVVIARPAPGD